MTTQNDIKADGITTIEITKSRQLFLKSLARQSGMKQRALNNHLVDRAVELFLNSPDTIVIFTSADIGKLRESYQAVAVTAAGRQPGITPT